MARMPELAQEASHLGRWRFGHTSLKQRNGLTGQKPGDETQPSRKNGRVVGARSLGKSRHLSICTPEKWEHQERVKG